MHSMALKVDDKNKMGIHFSLFYKKQIIFETIFWFAVTQNQVLDRAFL